LHADIAVALGAELLDLIFEFGKLAG